ncbi:VWA domain-containing protein [Winogradskyella sp.]|nr:VWA domain-containing protein [Winogradskyella sp.]
MSEFFDVEAAVNYEQKSLCVLLLDTSYSMEGKKLKSLQKGIEAFHKEITEDPTSKNRLEIAIIAYGSNIKILQQPALVDNFEMPKLQTMGSTSMGKAIDEAIELVGARKSWYKLTGQPYYRPWVINMTDGEPTDIPNIQSKGDEIRKHVDGKNFFFFNVGVKGASMNTLEKLSSIQMPPAKLEGLRFAEFFQWLSASIQIVAASSDVQTDSVNLPSPSNWMEGFKIS